MFCFLVFFAFCDNCKIFNYVWGQKIKFVNFPPCMSPALYFYWTILLFVTHVFWQDPAPVTHSCWIAHFYWPSFPCLLSPSYSGVPWNHFLNKLLYWDLCYFYYSSPKLPFTVLSSFLSSQPNRVCFGEPNLRFLNHLHCNKTSLSLIYLDYDNGLLVWFLACVFALLWIIPYRSQHITLLFKTFQCLPIDLRKTPRLS